MLELSSGWMILRSFQSCRQHFFASYCFVLVFGIRLFRFESEILDFVMSEPMQNFASISHLFCLEAKQLAHPALFLLAGNGSKTIGAS